MKNLCSAFRLGLRNGLSRYECFLWIYQYNPQDANILEKVYGK